MLKNVENISYKSKNQEYKLTEGLKYKKEQEKPMYIKMYKKLFVRNAFRLFLSSAGFILISLLASLFFSRAKKPTRILIFTERLLNKKICECHKLHGKCEYFKNKLKQNNKNCAPV